MHLLESIVIGAGQAGLSASRHLARRDIEHVVLDANDARPGVSHLAPLHLRSPAGGIQLEVGGSVQNAVTAVLDRRVQLVGYGPSASTIGANRAGRAAAIAVQRWLSAAKDELTA